MNTRMRSTNCIGVLGALGLILALGFWLRWHYIQTISLHVDEFTTMWAATLVQEHGMPWTPAGVLYTRGLLNTYVEALFFTLFGASPAVGRSVSLLFGLGSIVATFWIGGRSWNARVGLLAAAGLALLPEAIVWSGRARFYSQLQFFALLALWAAFEAITSSAEDKQRAKRERQWLWGFALFFLLALFSQEETLLLYPPILLAMLLWRGGRYFLQPHVIAVHGVIIVGIVTRYLIEIWGQPGYFETIQSTRPYVGFFFDLVGAWRVYGPLLVEPTRLPWTIFGVVAVVVAVIVFVRARRQVGGESKAQTSGGRDSLLADRRSGADSVESLSPCDRSTNGMTDGARLTLPRFHQASLFYALEFGAVLAVIFLVVGTSWRESRYLYFVQPLWLLLGAAGVILVVERLVAQERLRWAATGGVIGLALLLFWPSARGTLEQQMEGYDLVLDHVAATRGADDIILSPQPPACALMLGPCDGYAIQRGYEEFVIARDGELVDRWSGATLVNETEQLVSMLESGRPIWFVTDSFRLATRYDADYLRVILENFEIAHSERGVLALRAEGLRSSPRERDVVALEPALSFGPLTLTGYEVDTAEPGKALPVTLLWTAGTPVPTQYNTSLRLVAEDGSVIAQQDGPPAREIIPATLIFDQPVPDYKQLNIPPDAAPGTYRLALVVYDVATVTPLTEPQDIGAVDISAP